VWPLASRVIYCLVFLERMLYLALPQRQLPRRCGLHCGHNGPCSGN
jgi:hypothetical protein